MKKSKAQRKIENSKLKYDNEKLRKQCESLNDRNIILSMSFHNEKERADKFEKKYFDKLKDQMEYNRKDIVTLSLSMGLPMYDRYNLPATISKAQFDEDLKRWVCNNLARALYDNYECVRVTESDIAIRYDLMLLKWNDEQARREYEEMKMYMKP